jgi:hypothetical protein
MWSVVQPKVKSEARDHVSRTNMYENVRNRWLFSIQLQFALATAGKCLSAAQLIAEVKRNGYGHSGGV